MEKSDIRTILILVFLCFLVIYVVKPSLFPFVLTPTGVHGTVTYSDGSPVKRTTVTCTGPYSTSVITNDNGYYSLGLSAGDWVLTVLDEVREFSIASGEEKEINVIIGEITTTTTTTTTPTTTTPTTTITAITTTSFTTTSPTETTTATTITETGTTTTMTETSTTTTGTTIMTTVYTTVYTTTSFGTVTTETSTGTTVLTSTFTSVIKTTTPVQTVYTTTVETTITEVVPWTLDLSRYSSWILVLVSLIAIFVILVIIYKRREDREKL